MDANNSRYSTYTHPAYYNTSVHQVLDSANGSKVVENNQTWILTAGSSGSSHSGGSSDSNSSPASKVLYNTSTHATITPAEIAAGGTSWMVLDANNSRYSSYTHPAYYNTSVHQVLDSASGSKVGDWILTVASSSISVGVTLVEKVSNPNDQNRSYFGSFLSAEGNFLVTGSRYADIQSGNGTIYDAGLAYIYKINKSDGKSSLIKTLQSPNPTELGGFGFRVFLDDGILAVSSGPYPEYNYLDDGNRTIVDSNKSASIHIFKVNDVLYNTSTHATISTNEIAAGGTSWVLLDANNSNYTHPAYYNTSSHQVLDSAVGSKAGDWILHTAVEFDHTILAPDGLTTRDSFGRNMHLNDNLLTVAGVDYKSMTDKEGNATARIYRYKLQSNQTASLIQTITLQENVHDHHGNISFSQMGNRFIVGDSHYYDSLIEAGRVFVYNIGDDDKLSLTQTLTPPNSIAPLSEDSKTGYGKSIDQVGNIMAVGAFKDYYNSRYVGSVHLYKFDKNGIAQLISKVVPPDHNNTALGDHKFGRSVEIVEHSDGASLIIGAYYDSGSGSVYEFRLDSNGSTEYINKFTPSDGIDGDRFGKDIVSEGGFLHVSAYKKGEDNYYRTGAFYTLKLRHSSDSKYKSLYNSVSNDSISHDLLKNSNTSPWTLLDPNNDAYIGFVHPAYYNSQKHQVLDSSPGNSVDGWILTNFVDGTNTPFAEQIEDNGTNNSALVLYNQDTMQVITPEQVASGATDWLLLSPAKYPDKYTHPAYYNLTFHAVVENVSGDVEQGWTLRDPNSIGEDTTNPDLEKVLYNTTSHQVITRTQIAAGGTGWMALASGFVGKDGSTYSFPAYYNLSTHVVLDNSLGDAEGGWILTFPSVNISVSSSTGGTVLGGGNVSKYNNVSLSALPDKGYVFVEWSGGVTGNSNPSTIQASSDLTVYANFAKDTADSDGDGLSNYDELIVHDTNSTSSDTDGDGLSDKEEFDNGMNPKTSDKAMVDKIFLIMGSRGTTVTPYNDGWFYTEGRGWMYTSSSIYPYFYDHSTKGWMYFQSGHQTPRFYHYGTQTWMNIQSSSSTSN